MTIVKLLLAGVLAVGAMGAANDPCKGTTQVDINACAANAMKAAESQMQSAVAKLRSAASKTPGGAAKVDAMQKGWTAYRDEAIEAAFPAADKQQAYGSMYPTRVAGLREALARAHTAEVQKMLEYLSGRDLCGPNC